MKIKCGCELEITGKYSKSEMEAMKAYLTATIDCELMDLSAKVYPSSGSFVEFYDDDGNLIPVADDEEPLVSC